jgi:hypothetical protein
MAKRHKSDASQSVSLFPFLSVLACVIGTLTLMIAALALGQMDNPAVASAEQFESEKRRLEEEQQLIAQIEEQLKEVKADDPQRLLTAADEQRAELQEQIREEIAKRDKPVATDLPVVDVDAHDKRVAQLQAELDQIRERQKQLQQELAQRKKPAEEALVRVLPSGSGVDLTPTFVECNASGIVIYTGNTERTVRRADVAGDERFLTLLNEIADQAKRTVVFLVRDNGFGTYFAARDVARSHYARHGKLPVTGKGKIDVSMFDKKK